MSASPAQIIERLTTPIVLVGLMGVGKTTVGKRLARRLGLPFIDADHEIEQASGMKIAEMFDIYGEDSFRDGERRVIKRLLDGKKMVLATGGGAFINPETRALLRRDATTIWLDADIHVLADRVSRRATRPLLVGKNPVEVLTALAAQRNPIYAEAAIHVQSNRTPHDRTVDAIIAALGDFVSSPARQQRKEADA